MRQLKAHDVAALCHLYNFKGNSLYFPYITLFHYLFSVSHGITEVQADCIKCNFLLSPTALIFSKCERWPDFCQRVGQR